MGYGPSGEIRYILIPDGNENYGVAAVEPAASNCPPDSCIELFESRPIQSKRPEPPKGDSDLLEKVVLMDTICGGAQGAVTAL